MKKIFILLTFLSFISCGTNKTIIKEVPVETVIIDSIYVNEVTNEEREYNQSIFDSLVIHINKIKTGHSKECDSICNEKLNTLLETFTISKHSGVNSYELKYDKETNQLLLILKIGETKSTNIKQNNNSSQIKETVKEVPIKIEVPVETNILTWWQKFLIWIGSISLIYISFKVGFFVAKKYLKII